MAFKPDGMKRLAASLPALRPGESFPLDERQLMICLISRRLFAALMMLLTVMIIGAYLSHQGYTFAVGATNWMVLLSGITGGFISLQRRLKSLPGGDLALLAHSWVYVVLSPLVGGVLAMLLYILFISGLLQGDLFPKFVPDNPPGSPNAEVSTGNVIGIAQLFQIHGEHFHDYAKLVFWCFLAGFSETFVINIISHFETAGGPESSPAASKAPEPSPAKPLPLEKEP